ncbi:nitroreductase/quinone reductase family protein [Nocardia sp. NPDC004711]
MDQAAADLKHKVKRFNKVIVALQRAGIAFGSMYLLTAPGRKSGQPRTASMAVVPIGGQRYIIQAYPQAAWVANARTAQTVTLSRGRRAATVRLVELPVEERRPLLREHVANSPARVAQLFVRSGLAAEATAESVAAVADRIAVFRVESV